MYLNILHFTNDKTVLDDEFYEGGALFKQPYSDFHIKNV